MAMAAWPAHGQTERMKAQCDGCLGSRGCWICEGAGCRRCQQTGACHVCVLPQLAALVPSQADGRTRSAAATGAASEAAAPARR